MHSRANLRNQLEHDLQFDLEPRSSFTTACPKCVGDRVKSSAKSLSVYRNDEGMIWYRCNHAGQCEWNSWQSVKDPNPQYVSTVVASKAIMPIPAYESFPDTFAGDRLYWYKDLAGHYLFANRRIDFNNGEKSYVPFIYTEEGFKTGKYAKWPEGFTGLFGAETLRGKTKAIVVEGEKAAVAAQELYPGYAVVTWLGGSNRGYDKADWSSLKGIDTVLLWPDNDEPGHKCMREVSKLVPCRKILYAKVDHLPPKADLADPISNEDRLIAIKNAIHIGTKLPGVWSLEDIENQIKEATPSRSSGYDILDAHTRLPGSGLLVIEGRTKHGKSALAVALTSAMLERGEASSVMYYSYEMTAGKVYLRYIRALNEKVDDSNYGKSSEAIAVGSHINSSKLLLVDQSAQLGIGDIVLAASKPQVRGGIIVIDYLQIVPISAGFGRNTRQIVLKEMLDELRVAAHKNNVLVIVLSQLTPDYADPRNDSPREAKDIHYSADMVLRVWNRDVGENHPAYSALTSNFIIHTYLNREGESNVRFEANLIGGSRLTVKRRIKEK